MIDSIYSMVLNNPSTVLTSSGMVGCFLFVFGFFCVGRWGSWLMGFPLRIVGLVLAVGSMVLLFQTVDANDVGLISSNCVKGKISDALGNGKDISVRWVEIFHSQCETEAAPRE